MFPWDAGDYTFDIVSVLNNQMFDYFFNAIVIFGVLSLCIGWVVGLISKS